MVAPDIDTLVKLVVAEVRPGDQILCMSNGGFGGIHQKLIDAMQARRPVAVAQAAAIA